MRAFLIRHIGFAPESAAEWFALVFGTVVGGMVGFAVVSSVIAAIGGH